MQVSKEGLERIKTANPLEKVVAEHGVKLKKKGRVLVGLCPFHREKTGSFTITPEKGLFHCFGCEVAGDVIGFVVKRDKVSFRDAVEVLCRRAGLDTKELMQPRARAPRRTPVEVLTPPRELVEASVQASVTTEAAPLPGPAPAELLATVVEHYHESFCERADAQQYLMRRGITDADLLRAHKVGYADGSLKERLPRGGELRLGLRELGVLTSQGRELLGGCIVVPIADPVTGAWTTLYGRGIRTDRHCYLPGPLRGVLNYQAARSAEEVVLTESVLDALSFHQVGIATAIPLYGTQGFVACHLDLFKREGVRRIVLALDNDDAGRHATEALKEKLTAAGLAVRIASLPERIKDANELLVSCNGNAGEVFRRMLDDAEPRVVRVAVRALEEANAEATAATVMTDAMPIPDPSSKVSAGTPGEAPEQIPAPRAARAGGEDPVLSLNRAGLAYELRAQPVLAGRLRATLRVSRVGRFHVDTIDLLLSKSRTDFARKVVKAFGLDAAEAEKIEADLLALLVQAEKAQEIATQDGPPEPEPMSDADRKEAITFLLRPDLLAQVVRDAWMLGFVGEEKNIKTLFLIALSRRSAQPLSAVILSQSGAGKSVITDLMEQLTPPEDVVLFTRLTPQSLYYMDPSFLDRKLVIIEERQGSQEADYSVRILQSRGKLIAAAPVKDPATGNLKTRIFEVVARAAFVEATTAGEVNHENATRCFELSMDESEEQTRAIHERQRFLKTEAGLVQRQQMDAIRRRHWNAQRLLESLPVVIPFADRIEFPASWMRTRRDHARFLNLIEVSAFVHQYQRERRAGAIVASLADYEVAYDLAKEVLTETLSDLKRPLRDVYERLRAEIEKTGGPVSRRELREALQVPDSTLRRWLAELLALEYVELVSKAQQGSTARYRPAEAAPQRQVVGLLSPAELAGRIR